MEHTQGPWMIKWLGSSKIGTVKIVGREHFDEVATIKYVYNDPESKCGEGAANAQLIVTSPELLEALKGAQSALRKAMPYLPADNEAVYCGEWLDTINAAIAKATGE